jgi:hypothetical protein
VEVGTAPESALPGLHVQPSVAKARPVIPPVPGAAQSVERRLD